MRLVAGNSESARAQNDYALTLDYGGQTDGRLREIPGDLAAEVVYNANGAIRQYVEPGTSNVLMDIT